MLWHFGNQRALCALCHAACCGRSSWCAETLHSCKFCPESVYILLSDSPLIRPLIVYSLMDVAAGGEKS